jgi:hypothetical protein
MAEKKLTRKEIEENKMELLRKKFGMSTEKTIVDNLTEIPQKEKGVNMPITDVFADNNTHQIDLLFLPEDNGYNYALVCVDLASKYIGAKELKGKTPAETLKALQYICS